MSRRRKQSDAEISSDSFLDIIANIVGILIILIVVAGVRVSQAPVVSEVSPETVAASNQPLGSPIPLHLVGESSAPAWDERLPQTAPWEIPDPVVIDVTPEPDNRLIAERRAQRKERDELIRQLTRVTQETSAVHAQRESERAALELLESRFTEQSEQLRDARDKYNRSRLALVNARGETEASQREVARMQGLLVATEKDLAREQNAADEPALMLRHDMTPVSEIVRRKELHFLIEGGRISEVPIEELLEEIKRQMEHRKEWLLRSNRHIGTVGPMRGYQLEYIIEREMLSTIDQLRIGSNVVRIGLSKWIIKPDRETLVTETVEQAASSTSRFLVAIRSAPPDATCTFWVYPGSFETYQKFKSIVHQNGLRVAGRPLPEGMPISGSPQGSRSAAQ